MLRLNPDKESPSLEEYLRNNHVPMTRERAEEQALQDAKIQKKIKAIKESSLPVKTKKALTSSIRRTGSAAAVIAKNTPKALIYGTGIATAKAAKKAGDLTEKAGGKIGEIGLNYAEKNVPGVQDLVNTVSRTKQIYETGKAVGKAIKAGEALHAAGKVGTTLAKGALLAVPGVGEVVGLASTVGKVAGTAGKVVKGTGKAVVKSGEGLVNAVKEGGTIDQTVDKITKPITKVKDRVDAYKDLNKSITDKVNDNLKRDAERNAKYRAKEAYKDTNTDVDAQIKALEKQAGKLKYKLKAKDSEDDSDDKQGQPAKAEQSEEEFKGNQLKNKNYHVTEEWERGYKPDPSKVNAETKNKNMTKQVQKFMDQKQKFLSSIVTDAAAMLEQDSNTANGVSKRKQRAAAKKTAKLAGGSDKVSKSDINLEGHEGLYINFRRLRGELAQYLDHKYEQAWQKDDANPNSTQPNYLRTLIQIMRDLPKDYNIKQTLGIDEDQQYYASDQTEQDFEPILPSLQDYYHRIVDYMDQYLDITWSQIKDYQQTGADLYKQDQERKAWEKEATKDLKARARFERQQNRAAERAEEKLRKQAPRDLAREARKLDQDTKKQERNMFTDDKYIL